jgi:N-methylhydantoinase A
MTAGFEDVLEIDRQKRVQTSDLFLDPETPSFLAPRRQRVGIRERLDAQGNILQPLDELQVFQAVATLQQLYGVQTVIYPSFTCQVDDAGNLLLTLHTR